jgi:hypothetical protein
MDPANGSHHRRLLPRRRAGGLFVVASSFLGALTVVGCESAPIRAVRRVVAVGIFNQFIYVNPRERLVIAKSSANHTYGTGHGYDEAKDRESTHIALFKAIETALSNGP